MFAMTQNVTDRESVAEIDEIGNNCCLKRSGIVTLNVVGANGPTGSPVAPLGETSRPHWLTVRPYVTNQH